MLKNSSAKRKAKRHTYNQYSKNVVLIVGHSPRNPGAYSSYFKSTEFKFNTQLAQNIASIGQILNFIVIQKKSGTNQAYVEAISHDPCAIIEVHFNAFNEKATGVEVLASDRGDDKGLYETMLAQILLDKMSDATGLTKRRVKQIATRSQRGFVSLSQVSTVPSVIIEPFFGDNPKDCRQIELHYEALCKSIVDSIALFRRRIRE